MVFAGTGILMSSMEVLPQEDADFNTWNDREHMAERVAIPGFIEARRYASVDTPTRYLQIYNTRDSAVLDGPAYRAALARQTAWSMHHITRFITPTRVVGRLAHSQGTVRGVAVLLLRLRPAGAAAMLPALAGLLELLQLPGAGAIHFVEADPALSRPITADADYVGAQDCYVVLECTGVPAAQKILADLQPPPAAYGTLVDARVYQYRMEVTAAALAQAAAIPSGAR